MGQYDGHRENMKQLEEKQWCLKVEKKKRIEFEQVFLSLNIPHRLCHTTQD
jgi:hypothetical protein